MTIRPPRSLTAVVAEYYLTGVAFLIGGVLLSAVIALTSSHPGKTVATTALEGCIYGAILLPFFCRRVSRAAALQRTPPSDAHESNAAMVKRSAAQILAIPVLYAAAAALTSDKPIFGAMLAGGGAATLLTGRWLATWERKHDARVLRGPLWRPWDFYVVPLRGALADRADGRGQERGWARGRAPRGSSALTTS